MSEELQSFIDAGLSPQYVKTTLEDLATDQLTAESAIGRLQRQIAAVGGIALGGLLFGVVGLKAAKMLTNAVQQMGQALVETQRYVGMLGPPPVEQPPVRERSEYRQDGKGSVVETVVTDPNLVDVGANGYDPGPQEIPDDIRALVESDVLPPLDPDDLH